MNYTNLIHYLNSIENVNFVLPDNKQVPAHFHLTEAGYVVRNFTDCGGTNRKEEKVVLQLWVAGDTEHRLNAQKLIKILQSTSNLWQGLNPEVEIEYQSDTIGRYATEWDPAGAFKLVPMHTDCRASDKCGIPAEKQKVNLADIGERNKSACCSPAQGCC